MSLLTPSTPSTPSPPPPLRRWAPLTFHLPSSLSLARCPSLSPFRSTGLITQVSSRWFQWSTHCAARPISALSSLTAPACFASRSVTGARARWSPAPPRPGRGHRTASPAASPQAQAKSTVREPPPRPPVRHVPHHDPPHTHRCGRSRSPARTSALLQHYPVYVPRPALSPWVSANQAKPRLIVLAFLDCWGAHV